MAAPPINVRSTPESGHWSRRLAYPLRANSRHLNLPLDPTQLHSLNKFIRPCYDARWHSEAERSGGFCIYSELEFDRLLYGQFARICSAQDFGNVTCRPSIHVGKVGAVR